MSELTGSDVHTIEDKIPESPSGIASGEKQEIDRPQTNGKLHHLESIKEFKSLTDMDSQREQIEDDPENLLKSRTETSLNEVKFEDVNNPKFSGMKSATLVRELQRLLATKSTSLVQTDSLQETTLAKEESLLATSELRKETTTITVSEDTSSNLTKELRILTENSPGELHFHTESSSEPSQGTLKTQFALSKKRSLADITLGDLNRSYAERAVSSSDVKSAQSNREPVDFLASPHRILPEPSRDILNIPQTPSLDDRRTFAEIAPEELYQSYAFDKTPEEEPLNSNRAFHHSESSSSAPEVRITRRRSYRYVLNRNIEDIIEEDDSNQSVPEQRRPSLVNQRSTVHQARRDMPEFLDTPSYPAVQEPRGPPIHLDMIPEQQFRLHPIAIRVCRGSMVMTMLVFACVMLYLVVQRLIMYIEFRERQQEKTRTEINEILNGTT